MMCDCPIFPPDIEELFKRLNSYKINNLSLDDIVNNELIFNKIDITSPKQSKIINKSFHININDDDDEDFNIINGETNGGRFPSNVSKPYITKDFVFKSIISLNSSSLMILTFSTSKFFNFAINSAT